MSFVPTAIDLQNIFQVSNLVVLPFWALMVLLPNWSVTRRLMRYDIPLAALVGLYVKLSVTVGSIIVEAYSHLQPKLDTMAGRVSNSLVMSKGGTHCGGMKFLLGSAI